MASVGFGTVSPAAAVASPAARTSLAAGRRARPSTAHVPAATKVVTAASAPKQAEEKGLFDTIFGALYKEEQLLETDPVLNKVAGKARAAAPAPKKAAAAAAPEESGNGGFSLGGFFSKPKTKKGSPVPATEGSLGGEEMRRFTWAKEMQRFVIPTEYMGQWPFAELLREAESGFWPEGALRIPCDVESFESILRLVQQDGRKKEPPAMCSCSCSSEIEILCR